MCRSSWWLNLEVFEQMKLVGEHLVHPIFLHNGMFPSYSISSCGRIGRGETLHHLEHSLSQYFQMSRWRISLPLPFSFGHHLSRSGHSCLHESYTGQRHAHSGFGWILLGESLRLVQLHSFPLLLELLRQCHTYGRQYRLPAIALFRCEVKT